MKSKTKSKRLPIAKEIFKTPLPDGDIVYETFKIIPRNREEFLATWDRFLHNESYRVWLRLPEPLRIWIDPEDIYGEAYLEALRAYDEWDPKRSGYSTVMYRYVKNHLTSYVYRWSCRKRCPVGQIPMLRPTDSGTEVNVIDENQPVRILEPLIDPVLAYVVGKI